MAHVALYSPYIPKHSGGGEKYLLTIAEIVSRTHPTSLLVPAADVLETTARIGVYEKIFGLDLSRVDALASSVGSGRGVLPSLIKTRNFSHIFAMTDGSIFPSIARHSYFIVQVPWTHHLRAVDRVKLSTWSNVFVYSEFVRRVIEKNWQISPQVFSPYVDITAFAPASTKEKIILNVGRFFRHTQSNSKRQDVIIRAFKALVDRGGLDGYSLVLIGNVDPNKDSEEYIEELRTQAHGYHVNFLLNLPYTKLRDYYARAHFYWHAAGFEVDEQTHPENTEHFGMTTLEAMASGCIPFVVPNGGQREIVQDNMFFWNTVDELIAKMENMLHMKNNDLMSYQQRMRKEAATYSKDIFVRRIESLLEAA